MLDILKSKDLLHQCLLQVGDYQIKNFRSSNVKIEKKSHTSDLVTNVDKHSEKIIIEHIKKYYPDHSIFCESQDMIFKQTVTMNGL